MLLYCTLLILYCTTETGRRERAARISRPQINIKRLLFRSVWHVKINGGIACSIFVLTLKPSISTATGCILIILYPYDILLYYAIHLTVGPYSLENAIFFFFFYRVDGLEYSKCLLFWIFKTVIIVIII